MGSGITTCSNARTKEWQSYASEKLSSASKDYGPLLDKNYHRYLHLKSQKLYGFDNQFLKGEDDTILRDTVFKDLILFEYYVMPLKSISLEHFERKLKKLAYCQSSGSEYGQEIIMLKQLQVAFEDSPEIHKQLMEQNSILYKMVTDEMFHYQENQFDSNYEYYDEESEDIAWEKAEIQKIDIDHQKIKDIISDLGDLKMPDMVFEAGHIKDTEIQILHNSGDIMMTCDEKTASVTISDLTIQTKSKDFQIKNEQIGGAIGQMQLFCQKVSIKINLQHKNNDFNITSINFEILQNQISFKIEGNGAANILNKFIDLAKSLFVSKIVDQITEDFDDILKQNLNPTQIFNKHIKKLQDGIFSTKTQDLDLKLSVPKLMILGILYTSSSSLQRAQRFYELIQLDLEPQIFTGDEEFKDLFPLIGQLCYNFIIKHYNNSVKFLNSQDYGKTYPQLKSHIWSKIPAYVFDFKHDLIATKKFISTEIKDDLLNSIFGTAPFQEKEQFIQKLANRLQAYLRPEELRDIIYQKLDHEEIRKQRVENPNLATESSMNDGSLEKYQVEKEKDCTSVIVSQQQVETKMIDLSEGAANQTQEVKKSFGTPKILKKKESFVGNEGIKESVTPRKVQTPVKERSPVKQSTPAKSSTPVKASTLVSKSPSASKLRPTTPTKPTTPRPTTPVTGRKSGEKPPLQKKWK